ncbi:hypothetical protein D3874_21290 [Oleomonas cavernae]|uniref:Uncharacterized protein n=1 Tax=Oleomonas cavernae TaxID=2320859 RepID=A0A418WGM7_9PROT|nr:hypothetical protein [Oleomonas cavernae]RJF89194.1 hypothetical protein D3874_21290 [Oleomonas cavernae]
MPKVKPRVTHLAIFASRSAEICAAPLPDAVLTAREFIHSSYEHIAAMLAHRMSYDAIAVELAKVDCHVSGPTLRRYLSAFRRTERVAKLQKATKPPRPSATPTRAMVPIGAKPALPQPRTGFMGNVLDDDDEAL